jgi:hypothetical protein
MPCTRTIECSSIVIYVPFHATIEQMTEDFPHIIRFVLSEREGYAYINSDEALPLKWRDNLSEGFSEPSAWCVEHLGSRGVAWKRLHNGRMLFYYFRNKDDAAWFKLTWADWK